MPFWQFDSSESFYTDRNLESLYCTHDVNDDQHVYLDPNLASIISNAVAKIKSKQLKKPPKRKTACKYPCSVCEKNVNANQKGIKCDKCQL